MLKVWYNMKYHLVMNITKWMMHKPTGFLDSPPSRLKKNQPDQSDYQFKCLFIIRSVEDANQTQ